MKYIHLLKAARDWKVKKITETDWVIETPKGTYKNEAGKDYHFKTKQDALEELDYLRAEHKFDKKADKKIPAVEYRRMHDAIHHLALFNTVEEAKKSFEALKAMDDIDFGDIEEEQIYLDSAFQNCIDDIEVDYRTIQKDPKYEIVNKDYHLDLYI